MLVEFIFLKFKLTKISPGNLKPGSGCCWSLSEAYEDGGNEGGGLARRGSIKSLGEVRVRNSAVVGFQNEPSGKKEIVLYGYCSLLCGHEDN